MPQQVTATSKANWFLTALFVAMSLGLALAACGDGDGTPTAGGATPTPMPTVTATPRPGDAAASPTTERVPPTATATETPTAIPAPTSTPSPTALPVVGTDPLGTKLEGSGGTEPIERPATHAVIREATCGFEPPAGTNPTCYSLVVPENWRKPNNGNRVELPIAVFGRSGDGGSPTTPLVYLEGGPGGHVLDSLSLSFGSLFGKLTENHELIVFDQRGVGQSVPQLDCAEVDALFLEESSTIGTRSDEESDTLVAIAACRSRHLDDRIDISQYNSVSSAADLDAMRDLLGYEQWNLLGISYGTRLAQSAMRLYPDGIRSVILDSVVPVADDRPAIFAPNAERAINSLFAGCLGDNDCASEHPDLESRFFAMVDAWDAEPVEFSALNPLTLVETPFLFNGDDLMSVAFDALYSRASFATIPNVIAEAERGEYETVSALASTRLIQAEFFTTGFYLAVGCSEEDPFSRQAAVAENLPADEYYARFGDDFNGDFFFDVCDLWNVPAVDPIENEPITSAIPTLLLAGAYDPITPPDALDAVATGLELSYQAVFPHEGHGVSPTACGIEIIDAFVASPESAPDRGCVATSPKPNWTTDPDQPITMVDFAVDELAAIVQGVRPLEWDDQGSGLFLRGNTVTDPALLLIQNTFGLSASTLFGVYETPLGWDDTPTFVETRTVNGVDWDVYEGEFEASSMIAAVSQTGQDSAVLLVAGLPGDFPRFVTEVFEPALRAFAPL